MKYIDIHCHLESPDYDEDREDVIKRMHERGVGAITIGTDLENSKKAVEIAEQNDNVWACIGVHPDAVKEDFDEKEFSKLVKNPKVVAIGECGLDYLAPRSSSGTKSEVGFSVKQSQINLFEKQIEFALKHDKPLMLHCRDSYKDTLDILESYKEAAGPEAVRLKGNVHFFAGDVSVAKKFLDLGFTMSFTGVITFLPRRSSAKAGTHDYDEVIKFLPVNSIMSETDAPFVAPVPYRGKRNEPTYVIEVVKKMAEIRGENEEILNNSIINNTKRIFGISDIM